MFVEGVETEEVWRTLAARGRDGARSYHLSPLLPTEEFELWLRPGPESGRAGIAASGGASSLAS